METFISGCGKFNRSKDKDLIEARSALVKAWIDDVERAVEKVDKNLPDMMARHIADICYRESERLKTYTMERKIGEIFEYKGEWYQTVKSQGKCCSCDFMIDGHCIVDFSSNGSCFDCHRKDKENIIFKKLEKVGEPYNIGTHIYQRYKVFMKPYIFNDSYFAVNPAIDDEFINIEVKQTKEYMEEKKLNLKPFDLQKAKQGKPVCTRDGRKARIICFDRENEQPIVALIKDDEEEYIDTFFNNGHSVSKTNEVAGDLMMLPEKKEGWVNVYDADTTFYFVEGMVYDTKEEAVKHINPDHEIYTTTVKIEWEK